MAPHFDQNSCDSVVTVNIQQEDRSVKRFVRNGIRVAVRESVRENSLSGEDADGGSPSASSMILLRSLALLLRANHDDGKQQRRQNGQGAVFRTFLRAETRPLLSLDKPHDITSFHSLWTGRSTDRA